MERNGKPPKKKEAGELRENTEFTDLEKEVGEDQQVENKL